MAMTRALSLVLFALAVAWAAGPAAGQDARELYNKGVGLANAGQVEQAAEMFRQAIAQDPSLALAHYNLGIAMQTLKRHAEALPAFQEAARLDPNHAPSAMNVGATYQAMGNAPEAARAYREAVRLKPDDPEAQFGLCWMLLESKQVRGAQEEYANLARLSQSRADALYTDYKSMPGTVPVDPVPADPVPASAMPQPATLAPVITATALHHGVTAGARYRATERLAVVTGAGAARTRLQTLRELAYAVTVTKAAGSALERRVTLESAKVMRDGVEQPSAHRAPATWTFRPTGEPIAGAAGIEPALCRPVFPPEGALPGATWEWALTPVPGTFPPVAVALTARLERLEGHRGATCARIAAKGGSAPGPASAKVNASLLWDLSTGRLVSLRARGVSEDSVSRAGGPAVARTVSYEVSVDAVP